MADGPDANLHDDHGHDAPLQDHPDHDTAVHGGHAAQDDPHGTDPSAEAEVAHGEDAHAGEDDHGHGGHDDHGHGHDDHGHGEPDDAWVLLPIAVGLVIGLVLAVIFGFGTHAPAFL